MTHCVCVHDTLRVCPGKRGNLLEYDAARERWGVQLFGVPAPLSIRATNLVRCDTLHALQPRPSSMVNRLRAREVGQGRGADEGFERRAQALHLTLTPYPPNPNPNPNRVQALQALHTAGDRDASMEDRLAAWNDTLNEVGAPDHPAS